MEKILNRTKTEWIIINDENEIWVGPNHSYFIPLSELNDTKVSIKSYRGWGSAINGILSAGGCSEEDIRNNRIRVLPVTTVLQVDESYKEVPVSNYFKEEEIKRYVLTESYNLILDLNDSLFKPYKLRYGGKIENHVSWEKKDEYGVLRRYYDRIIKSSDNKEELEKHQKKLQNKEDH